MKGKNPLHPDPVGNLANRKGGPHFPFSFSDHHTLENLDSLFVPFLDLGMHFNRVARSEVGYVQPHLFSFDRFNNVHSSSSKSQAILFSVMCRLFEINGWAMEVSLKT